MTSLLDKKLILVGGPGGVGKTTLSAALAVQCALKGHRTVVLTVDPARRLAQALGLSEFSSDLTQVPLPAGAGTLQASMLHAERDFDRLIRRVSPTPEHAERILTNPMYRVMVESLGGTHEYAAMEKLLEFATEGNFDRIVIDTPPTQNAMDLLSAPTRLSSFMDNKVFQWFLGESPTYLRLFQAGTQLAMKLLQNVLGADFLKNFATFIGAFQGLQGEFQRRNVEVLKLLKGEETGFYLVSFPSESRYREAVAFQSVLQEQGIPVRALLLNRVEPRDLLDEKSFLPPWDRLALYHRQLVTAQQKWRGEFGISFSRGLLKEVPWMGEIHDLAGLTRIGDLLVS